MKEIMNKFPDIYFDWYARLIPWAIGFGYYLLLNNFKLEKLSLSMIIFFVIASYILGHIVQPISSFFISLLQKLIKSNENIYRNAKKQDKHKNLILKVSKAHAEAVGMLSSALLVFVISLYLNKFDTLTYILFSYFIIATIERVFSRKSKIEDIA